MSDTQSHIDRHDPSLWRELAQQLRVDAVRATATAGSGHPSSGMSAADLMAVLLARHLRYDFGHPRDPANDHLIFSKGHASPLLYALYRAAGAITDQELMSYRRLGSRLEGHPTPRLPWVDVATGSLGLGLPVGGERFPIGGSRTLRSSNHDHLTLLAAGVTVHEALAAADLLASTGIHARVIDLYSVKPLDTPTVLDAALETGNLIVAEDHWAQGGLGDAVLEALADAGSNARVRRLAVHTMPTSGRPDDLLWRSGIDRTWIATAARDLLEQPAAHNGHRRAHTHA